MKIYISIPMTGGEPEGRGYIGRLADYSVYKHGHIPVNRLNVQVPDGMDGKEAYAYCMGRGIENLLRCDAILMAHTQWPRSRECSIEHFIADRMCMEIYYDIHDIPDDNGDKGDETD